MSILLHPIWQSLSRYLVVEKYDRDGGHEDPRIRIELRDMPLEVGRIASFSQMACVVCGRPIHPLRRREGHELSQLYYAPTCLIGVRIACSRSSKARAEYDRFKLVGKMIEAAPRQLVLVL